MGARQGGPSLTFVRLTLTAALLILAPVSGRAAEPGGLGYLLFDLRTGAAVDELNADRLFIPASTTKLATCFAALRVLGSAAFFQTSIAVGPARGGLAGDVALVGGGDPTLSTEDLDELAAGLGAALLPTGTASTAPVSIGGRFFFDESALPPFEAIDGTQPLGAPYNVGGGALAINFDRIRVGWHRVAGGLEIAAPVSVSSTRSLLASTIRAEPAARDLGAAVPYLPYAAPDGSELWQLSPGITPAKGEAWLPVRRPGRLAAALFRNVALGAGIALPPPEAGSTPQALRPVVRHNSKPLFEIASGTLKYSNNLSAEMIGLATARKIAGRGLALATATQTVAAWWRSTLPRTDWSGWQMATFSGLSSAGRATPRQLSALLLAAAQPGPDGLDLLGTLPARDELHLPGIFAKTGTLEYASSMAGTITTRGHGRLGFVVMVTDFAGRATVDQDRDTRRLVRGENRAWTEAAHRLEKSVLERWLATQ